MFLNTFIKPTWKITSQAFSALPQHLSFNTDTTTIALLKIVSGQTWWVVMYPPSYVVDIHMAHKSKTKENRVSLAISYESLPSKKLDEQKWRS